MGANGSLASACQRTSPITMTLKILILCAGLLNPALQGAVAHVRSYHTGWMGWDIDRDLYL